MEEDYCSFEVSKLAKEKGFDWECLFFFDKDGKEVEPAEENHYGCEGGMHLSEWFRNYNIRFISKPTHSLLQKWLREKHKIYVFVQPTIVLGISKEKTKWKSNFHKKGILNNTAELAMDNGLLEALKLVK